jgi:large subunit ribosomal protein L25
MKTVSLSGSLRGNVGKKDAKDLRKQGLVPCVVYGGKEQIHFFLDEREFIKLLFSPETYIVKIRIDENEINTLLQDVQYHPVSDKVLHADFLEFDMDKPVKVAIPVRAKGVSPGVLKGGSLKMAMRKIMLRAVPKDIPDYLEVDISKLEIGDSIKVRDLVVENIQFLDRPDMLVVSVKVTRVVVSVDEDEEEGEEGAPAEGGEEPAAEGDKAAE